MDNGGAQYYQSPGPLGTYYSKAGYSHAVLLPPNARLVVTAGQPGLDTNIGKCSEDPGEQIEAAFDNCDKALKAAGVVDGLQSAYKVLSWLIDLDHEPLMMEIWRRRYPNHRPTWTCVGTSRLAMQGMIVEIQVDSYIMDSKPAA